MPNINDIDPTLISAQPPSATVAGAAGNINQVHPDQIETEEEHYSTPGQMALTVGEGALEGFVGPVKTGAEALLSNAGVPGLSSSEQVARANANPLLHYGSELAGFGAGVFTGTGEAALLAKVGEGAVQAAKIGEGVSLASKIASGAVQGAAELSTFQAGDEISKAINQDPNQTLGTAAINVGLSALMGGAGGAVLGSVSPLWKAYTQGVAEDAEMAGAKVPESPTLPNIESEISVSGGPSIETKSYPSGPDEMVDAIQDPKDKESFLEGIRKQKDNAEEIKKAGELIGAPVTPGMTSDSEYVQDMESALTQSPTIAGVKSQQAIDRGFEKVSAILDDALGSEVETTPYQRGEIIKNQIADQVDEIYEPIKAAYALRGLEGLIIDLSGADRLSAAKELKALGKGFGSVGSEGGKAIQEIADRLLPQTNVNQLDELIKEVSSKQRVAYQAGDTHLSTALNKAKAFLEDFQVNQIAKFGGKLASVGGEDAEAIAQQIISEHKILKAKYADFKGILEDLSSGAKLGRRANTVGGLLDVLENVPNEKMVDKLFTTNNYEALKNLKERFPKVFQTIIDGKKADILKNASSATAALKAIDKLSPEVKSLMFSPEEIEKLEACKTWVDALPSKVGPSGTPQGIAYMQAVNGHPIAQIINNAKDFTIKQLLKFATPREAEINKVATDYIQTAIKGEKTLNTAVKNIFRTGEILPKNLLPDEDSRKKLEKSLAYLDSPNNLMRVGGDIGAYMPNHQVGVAAMAQSAKDYLDLLKPKQSQTSPLDAKMPIDRLAQIRYNRALDVAQQPLMVLKHVKNGSLLPQDVTTLQTIYPGLHSALIEKINDEMTNHLSKDDTSVPHSMRQGLSMLMGVPLDTSQTQFGMQQILASAYHQEQPQQPGQPAKKASGVELRQIDKTNSLYQTNAQARQSDRRS